MNARADTATHSRIAFSDRLRMLLVQHGHALIPEQLARDFTASAKRITTSQTVSNWLNGVQTPLPGNLQALAVWLNVTPDFLTHGIPVLHSAPVKISDVDTAQLVEHFQQLDPYGRRMVLAMAAAAVRLKGGAA